ncbi:MAG: DnaD domain protein [Lachnospiraceae bacterium]|nr:DnaD domain protein [Lachnospiraceae bacterium]
MSSPLKLTRIPEIEYTLVSNDFIDHYMPQANGSYVKVYLSLLRMMSSHTAEFGITQLADKLDETEKDVLRALKYWEKQQLLSLEYDTENTLCGIAFLTPAVSNRSCEDTAVTTEPSAANSTPASDGANPISDINAFEIPNYSDSQIQALSSLDDVQWVLSTLPRLLERLLKPSDIQFVLYLYESIGFSAELIVHLYEYCASRNKKSHSYIESVALAWAKEGIDTVEKAEASTTIYNTNFGAVNRAFGLNRAPGRIEKEYMHRWFHTYGFDIPIIEEACNRTLLAVSKPDFKYADKILERWHTAGVKQKSDIAALDSEFARQNTAKDKAAKTAQSNSAPPANNRFNTFPQRKYTAADYSSMEERLLNK